MVSGKYVYVNVGKGEKREDGKCLAKGEKRRKYSSTTRGRESQIVACDARDWLPCSIQRFIWMAGVREKRKGLHHLNLAPGKK